MKMEEFFKNQPSNNENNDIKIIPVNKDEVKITEDQYSEYETGGQLTKIQDNNILINELNLDPQMVAYNTTLMYLNTELNKLKEKNINEEKSAAKELIKKEINDVNKIIEYYKKVIPPKKRNRKDKTRRQ